MTGEQADGAAVRAAPADGIPAAPTGGTGTGLGADSETRSITATAPVRACDLGGWTDTWFGGPGRVLNLAMAPGARVTVTRTAGPAPVILSVPDFADRYPVVPGSPLPGRHRLLESALDLLPPPPGGPVEVVVRTGVPPGCGTGTSAAVAVALLAALGAWRGEAQGPTELARTAHRLETEVVGAESGVQDQLAAALGGITYLEVDAYPAATATPLGHWAALDDHLAVVDLGRAHDSSSLHRQVIADRSARARAALDRLREAACAGREAAAGRDLLGLGRAMVANTEAQAALHPALVGTAARRVVASAGAEGALGWKVNGAGGDGGSVTLLARDAGARTVLGRRLAEELGLGLLPLRLSPAGVQVTAGP